MILSSSVQGKILCFKTTFNIFFPEQSSDHQEGNRGLSDYSDNDHAQKSSNSNKLSGTMNVLHDVAEDHIQTSGDSKRPINPKAQNAISAVFIMEAIPPLWRRFGTSWTIPARFRDGSVNISILNPLYHTCCAGLEGKILNCHCDHYCYGRGDHHNRNGRLF